jgi:hypothetical protein
MLVGTIRGHVVAVSFVGNALSTATGNVFVVPRNQAYAGYLIALVSITLGVLVWERRPDSRTGILLMAFPLAGVLADPIVFPGSRLAVTVGLAASQLGAVIAAHLILSYPTGRFTSRLDRAFCRRLDSRSSLPPFLLFYSPSTHEQWFPECLSAKPHHARCLARRDPGERRSQWSRRRQVVLFTVLLLHKIVRAVPVARASRHRSPSWPSSAPPVASCSGCLVISSEVSWSSAWDWSGMFVTLAISLALAAGMLWGRAGRGAVADLVVELERTPPGRYGRTRARARRSASGLALWLPDRAAYVSGEGGRSGLPATVGSGGDGARSEGAMAALVHDPHCSSGGLEAAGAAARLALENERLQAELRAQLVELRASRARIVSAGDDERRRLERDLHDGAQQRLLSLGLALQLIRDELGQEANGATELLSGGRRAASGAEAAGWRGASTRC